MKSLLTILHTIIIILLAAGCFDSREEENEQDSGSGDSDTIDQGDKTDKPNTDSGVRNVCEEAKKIRLGAIREKCAEPNLVGCCYCLCELTGGGKFDCSCQNWQLTNNRAVTPCEGGDLTAAMTCINNKKSCAERIKTIVDLNCN